MVITVRLDKMLVIAREIMRRHSVHHVPVVDHESHLVGLISHRDLLDCSVSRIDSRIAQMEGQQHLWSVPISRAMKTDVVTVAPGTTVQEAARQMRTAKIGCLPVISRDQLVGIVTEHDLLHVLENLDTTEWHPWSPVPH